MALLPFSSVNSPPSPEKTVPSTDPTQLATADSRGLEQLYLKARELLQQRLSPEHSWACPAGPLAAELYYDAEHLELCENFATWGIQQLQFLYRQLGNGYTGEVLFLDTLSREILQLLSLDRDATLACLLNSSSDTWPYSQAIKTATLAQAMGQILGLSDRQLCELGIGCLVHDVGMLQLNPSLQNGAQLFNQLEELELTRHPIFTWAIVQNIPEMSEIARFVAYQMHERTDGSGYPGNATHMEIHPFARLAAVADVYAGLTSPRPHRRSISPSQALQQILHGTLLKQFDPGCTRALLNVLSFFPLGSQVTLSDGRTATVYRTNGQHYAEPLLSYEDEGQTRLLNLYHERHLHIARAEPAARGESIGEVVG